MDEILVGAAGSIEKDRIVIEVIGFGEGPKDARVQDNSLASARIDGQVIGNLPAKAAMLFVDCEPEPEGKDVGA
ncbi:MAG TPA: hypothetical protein VGF01_03225 [Terracidiphilus sp.]